MRNYGLWVKVFLFTGFRIQKTINHQRGCFCNGWTRVRWTLLRSYFVSHRWPQPLVSSTLLPPNSYICLQIILPAKANVKQHYRCKSVFNCAAISSNVSFAHWTTNLFVVYCDANVRTANWTVRDLLFCNTSKIK